MTVDGKEKKTEDGIERTDQKMELDLDDLDDAAGGKSASHYQGDRPDVIIGSPGLYEGLEDIRNRTFRR